MRCLHGINNLKPSRAFALAGWIRQTAMHVFRAKGPAGFAKGQDSTLGIQTHPFHFGLLIFFLFSFHMRINFSFHNSTKLVIPDESA
jgi:hypothetical protein